MTSILETLPPSWLKIVADKWEVAAQNNWERKIQHCVSKKKVTPSISLIFKAFQLCSPESVKVIILGQDPYPTEGHAHGLAFSTAENVFPFPKSLTNIFKELKGSLPSYNFPSTGNLETWAKQGVLLLNTCLTTEIGQANAHQGKGWEELTTLFLNYLNESSENLVILFWGKQAQAQMPLFNPEKHLLLHTSHPSPLSVHRGFLGCNHFVSCNIYLKSKKITEINWQS